jgi:hypothetical protein
MVSRASLVLPCRHYPREIQLIFTMTPQLILDVALNRVLYSSRSGLQVNEHQFIDLRREMGVRLLSSVLFLVSLAISGPASASTECSVTLSRLFSGDDGYLWLHYTNGGSSYLAPTDPDKALTSSLAITALTTGKSLIVRYQADGVPCNSLGRTDLIGVYLVQS